VCKRWEAISCDDLLWKAIFARSFAIDYHTISLPPGKASWKKEYLRIKVR
jgi:hypothetical protein